MNTLRIHCTLVGIVFLSLGPQKAVSAEGGTTSFTEIRVAAGNNLAVNGSGDYVMNLSDFVAEEGSKVTLKGKRGTKFVINVSGDFDIRGARIVLGGGLLPSDVVFNLTGTSAAVRQITGNSVFSGNLQVVGSQVTVSDSLVNGRRIRGVSQMGVVSGSATTARIKPPPKPRGPVSP